jgi:hypothetical protein
MALISGITMKVCFNAYRPGVFCSGSSMWLAQTRKTTLTSSFCTLARSFDMGRINQAIPEQYVPELSVHKNRNVQFSFSHKTNCLCQLILAAPPVPQECRKWPWYWITGISSGMLYRILVIAYTMPADRISIMIQDNEPATPGLPTSGLTTAWFGTFSPPLAATQKWTQQPVVDLFYN